MDKTMPTELTLDCKIRVGSYLPSKEFCPAPKLWLIEYIGNHWPKKHLDYILLRDKDYKKIISVADNKWLPEDARILLPEYIPVEVRVNRYSVRYLKAYFNGDWDASGNYDFDWTLNPQRYLNRGDFTNFYVGSPSWDGYIRQLDGGILTRKVECEFYASDYDIYALQKVFQEHSQFSEITIESGMHGICSSKLIALYQPKPGELSKYARRSDRKEYGLTDVGGSYGMVHNMSVIKKFRKKVDYDC